MTRYRLVACSDGQLSEGEIRDAMRALPVWSACASALRAAIEGAGDAWIPVEDRLPANGMEATYWVTIETESGGRSARTCEEKCFFNHDYAAACERWNRRTQAPTDSAVEPAGVSDERLRHLRGWYRQEFADLSNSQMIAAQTASICDELLAARQQLAEMRGIPLGTITHAIVHKMCHYLRDKDCAKCPATVATPYGDGEPGCYGIAFETVQMARSLLYEATLASPSQPSRGKCETCGGIRVLRRVDFEGTPIDDAPCPDCAQPQSITQELREAAKCKTCNGRQRRQRAAVIRALAALGGDT